MPALRNTARAWCFTLNNPSTHELQPNAKIRYCSWQAERGDSGTEHLQGYVELNSPQRLSFLQTWLPGAHFEPRNGTREQARDYTRKSEGRISGPFEIGNWETGGHGNRSDLLAVKRRLDEGGNEKNIAEEHFGTWCKYYKAFREYDKIKTPSRNWQMQVYVFWGESGTGKSKRCMDEHPNACWKTRDEWWDNYDSHETVIIDDFYGWLPYDLLLRLLDRYPLDVPIKGGHRRFVAKTICITSNKHPQEWYTNVADKTPLLRRITRVEHYTNAFK